MVESRIRLAYSGLRKDYRAILLNAIPRREPEPCQTRGFCRLRIWEEITGMRSGSSIHQMPNHHLHLPTILDLQMAAKQIAKTKTTIGCLTQRSKQGF